MRLRVTSTGITQAGTTSRHIIINNTPILTMTTISEKAPCTTITRIPNKPFPSPTSSILTAAKDVIFSSHILSRKRNLTITTLSPKTSVPTPNPPDTLTIVKIPATQPITTTLPTKKRSTKTLPAKLEITDTDKRDKANRKTQRIHKIVQPSNDTTKNVIPKIISKVVKPKKKGRKEKHTPKSDIHKSKKKIIVIKKDLTISAVQSKTVFVKDIAQPTVCVVSKPSTVDHRGKNSTESSAPKNIIIKYPEDLPRTQPKATKRKSETLASKSCSTTKIATKNIKGNIVRVSTTLPARVTGNFKVPLPVVNTETIQVSTTKSKRRIKTWKQSVGDKSRRVSIHSIKSSLTVDKAQRLKTKNNGKQVEMPLSPFCTEIKDLLYTFGDSVEPLKSTIQVMEIVVKEELFGFVKICEYKAGIRGGSTLGLTEAILALRQNVPRINRLYKHLGIKDLYNRKYALQSQPLQNNGHKKPSYTKEIHRIVKDLNLVEFYHLLKIGLDDIEASVQGMEDPNLEYAIRSNTQMRKFYQYAKTRSLSFARKLSTVNIINWLLANCHIHSKVTDTFVQVLHFLTLELVAEIIDSAFGIRRERLVTCTETRVANPDTCMSAPYFLKKRKDDRCNQVSEILVQASEMEATRLKKEQRKRIDGSRRVVSLSKSIAILYPGFVREAYMRLQADPSRPSPSFFIQANVIKHININYP